MMTTEEKVIAAQAQIDSWKGQFKNKSTLLFLAQTKMNNRDVNYIYDKAMDSLVQTIKKSTEKLGFDIDWYKVPSQTPGLSEFYITGSEKFYEMYKTDESVKNYIFARSIGLFGYVLTKEKE